MVGSDLMNGWNLRQQPSMALFFSLAIGTCCDRLFPWSLEAYAALFGMSLVAWAVGFERSSGRFSSACHYESQRTRWKQVSFVCFYIAVISSGAAWHHQHWHRYLTDDVSRFASVSRHASKPVRIRGKIVSTIGRNVSSLDGSLRASFTLRGATLKDGPVWRTVSGDLYVAVSGDVPSLMPGDEIQVAGQIRRVAAPLNPAETDRRLYFRSRRILARLDAPRPECVVVMRSAGVASPGWLLRWTDRADEGLKRRLGPTAHPIATALLLGRRQHLSREQRDQFLRTGTVHMLAISGLHVGILAGAMVTATRGGLVPERIGILLIMVATWGFTLVAGSQAPVMRANLLVQTTCLGWLIRLRSTPMNSLAFAAVLVWARCPSDLFQVGPQLSFLAVVVLSCLYAANRLQSSDPLDRLIWRSLPRYRRVLIGGTRYVARSLWCSFLVWCLTMPLVLWQFHVIATSAIFLNLLLFLPLAMSLLSGFGLLLVQDVCSPIAEVLAVVCRGSVNCFYRPIVWADSLPGAYLWWAGIGPLATIAFYLLWGIVWGLMAWQTHRWRWLTCSLLIFGLGIAEGVWLRRVPPGQLRCAFLSVGHGTCVVLQLPGNRTWLYDCGRMGWSEGTVEMVSQYLWSRRISRLDRVILSHPDSDHYNLLPGLLARFSIREVTTSEFFWDALPSTLRSLRDQLQRRGVLLTVCRSGDTWHIDSQVCVEVLHPPANRIPDSDNANSIVLEIHATGHSLLLPGDLEGMGLESICNSPLRATTVAMAPHHGSQESHPARFVSWCQPRWMVVSGKWSSDAAVEGAGRGAAGPVTPGAAQPLHAKPQTVHMLHTDRDGAIEIQMGGRSLIVCPFLTRDETE